MKSLDELFDEVLEQLVGEIHVQCPCRVVSVNGNFVNAVAIINDEELFIKRVNTRIKFHVT